MKKLDPIVAEIRSIREQLLADAGGDIHQYAQNAQRLVQDMGLKVVTLEQIRAKRKVELKNRESSTTQQSKIA